MFLRLLLILIAIVVLLRLLGWRPPAPRQAVEPPPPPPHPLGDLVQCSRCGVYVPRQHGLQQDGHWFCCAEHRDAR